MIKKYFLLIRFWTICMCLSAQNFVGKITDEKSQPLPYVNVVLLSFPDSAFVTGTVSDESGGFTLKTHKNDLLLRVSSIGYTTIYRKVEKADLGTIQLLPDAQLLGEVVVQGDLPKMRLKGDAMVMNVAGTILEKAGTGEDVLNKLPGVSAGSGKVNVFGAGAPEIYINGRRVRDHTELDQLSSDNIKSVEVVNTPGARYDATVKAVIRIKTKKPQGEGFGFNNRFYASYQYDWNVLDQFNFNYRKGGFDLSGMLFGYDTQTEEHKKLVQQTYLDQVWEQNTWLDKRYHVQKLSTHLSLNYQFNENHFAGVRYDYDRTPKNRLDFNPIYTEVFRNNVLYEQNSNTGWENSLETQHTVNAYYNGQIGDWNIDFNADGLWADNKTPQEMLEQITSAEGDVAEQTVTTRSLTENELYASKLIISRPLWDGNLSVGGEYTYTDRLNNYWNVEGILDDDNSNIKENDVSVFAEYARSFGKLQAQVGVRYEHLASDYYEAGKRMDEQSRTYDNVFPSAALSFPVGKAQLQLSYTGSIYRPSFWMLRSNITYANRYTYESGNPLLRPSLINSLSLDASYKWIYFNARYMHGHDAIIQLSQAYSEQNPTISLFTYYNKYDSDKLYATLTLSPTISIWSPQLTLMLLQQWYKVDTPEGQVNFNNPMGSFTWRNNFRLPAGFVLDVDLGANTTGHDENVFASEGCWYANVSLYKGFFNERLTFQLKANDLFNSS